MLGTALRLSTRLRLPRAPAEERLPAAVVAGFVVLYFLLDWVSYVHPMRGTNITPWNPQAALAVALLSRSPRYWWLVGLTLVSAALAHDLPLWSWSELFASATLGIGYAATAAAFRRWLGPAPWIADRKAYSLFLTIAVVGAALDSLLYVGTLGVLGSAPAELLAVAFLRGWIGDVVSLVVTLPAIVALADPARRAETAEMLRTLEWWLVAASALLGAYLVFGRPTEDQFKFFYLLFLPVAWGAARFGKVGAVWSAAVVQALLILAVQTSAYRPLTVFELHMLMAALGATGLLLGATVEEREKAERALRASLHAAAAADMAAALAHELNQPLTALRTYARAAQLLAERDGDPRDAAREPLLDVTGKLVGEANRAGEVVNRLRDFFRHRGTDLQHAQLAPLIDDVVQSQAMRAQAVGVALRSEVAGALPAVWMDRVQIQVVLRNLVANAIEAAAQRPGPQAAVTIGARRVGDAVHVCVLDSGEGIAAADLPQVFETRRSSKPGGMGIGLMISRSIVEAHDGSLWAEAGPGGKFFFKLPSSTDEPAD